MLRGALWKRIFKNHRKVCTHMSKSAIPSETSCKSGRLKAYVFHTFRRPNLDETGVNYMLFEHFFALSISLEFLPTDRSFVTKIMKILYFTIFLCTFKPSEFPWCRSWLAIRDAGPRTRPSRNYCNLHAF